MPLIATALEKGTGNKLAGLSYPIGIAIITALVGGFFIKERMNVVLDDTAEAPVEG